MKAKFYLTPRFRYLIVLLFILLNAFSNQAKAQMVLVPDSNFRNALIAQGFGSCFTGNYIDSTCSLVSGCTALNVVQKNISDLTGIEAFKNLSSLHCELNYLTNLPSLPNSLTELSCGENLLANLATLPISLTTLNCYGNQLTNLPTLPNFLTTLVCNNNQLTNLPILPNPLNILDCHFNQLTILPSLPNTLTYLNCAGNNLTNLPPLPNILSYLNCASNQLHNTFNTLVLPDSLDIFNCGNNQITVLHSLPNRLTQLDCSDNLLQTLPSLSDSIVFIFCERNPIINLPDLPLNLLELWCFRCNLTTLPALPINVRGILCWSNNLTSLPALPPHLYELKCWDNNLTKIPDLPVNLGYLFAHTNNLLSLPELPSSLRQLSCSYNPNLLCLPNLNNLLELDFVNTGITCIPNYGHLNSCYPPLNTLPLCGFINPGGCNVYWNISGKTYYDSDTNCVYNGSDFAQRNMKIKLLQNNNLKQQTFSGGEGFYSFNTDSVGIFKILLDTTDIPFIVNCPVQSMFVDTILTQNTLIYNQDFSLKCKPGFDVAAWSIYGIGFIPGHQVEININAGDYSNMFGAHCANGMGGIVKIIHSGAVNFIGPSIGALNPIISGDTLIYNIADFSLVNATSAFNFLIEIESNATMGSNACFDILITPAMDNNPSNNSISDCFIIRSSFDPNDKIVYPQNGLDIHGERWLTYTINFQNTGTAPAENIYILDTLDANLDLSTFQLLAYNHQPYVQILEGGIAKFNFPNINLPDSVSDEPHSHGYVQYKVKAKPGLGAGVFISNTAHIYFDFNVPVATNTVSNTMLNCPVNVHNKNLTLCEGEEYNFNGLILKQSGRYTKHFLNSLGCDSVITLNLLVKKTNTLVTQSHDTLLSLATNATFQWMNCGTGGKIPGTISHIFVPTSSGSYAVIVNVGGCVDTSMCYNVNFTSLNETYLNDIQISPNPSNDEFVVYSPQNVTGKNVSITIFDAYGKLIEQKQLVTNNTILKATSWAKGIYFIQIDSEGNRCVKKLVKK